MAAPNLQALDAELETLPGAISVWCARIGPGKPDYAREEDTTHYAASTMKAAVLAALYRAGEAGILDLDAPVPVLNDFRSAKPGAPRFQNAQDYDQDDDVWALLGATATLRWLARRMIIRSSNFATNLVLSHVGVPAVAEVLRIAGTTHMRIGRGIEDADAREAGIDNLVTARDLATLLGKIALDAGHNGAAGDGPREPLAKPEACQAMLEVLFAQEHLEDLAAGLPPGTRIAHKNGWIEGVRHGAGVVFPDDAPPYAIVVCITSPLADSEDGDDACTLIARIAAASWADRHELDR
jgi:beta-lactamase class A